MMAVEGWERRKSKWSRHDAVCRNRIRIVARASSHLAARLFHEQARVQCTESAFADSDLGAPHRRFAFLLKPDMPGLNIPLTPQTPLLGAIGIALDLVGVAFAIWARLVLGRNWSGLVMRVKEGHELVQSGPYAIVRHPIYAGLLLAIVGTALTLGTVASYIGLAAGAAALIIRVHFEEELMNQEFRKTHEAYRRRTKKLVPFVW
jgi:protein-S-isoprenylcysteine O-methyltransferase Ste14